MHASNSSTSTHRARWAAIGAAVAVSLGAGGLGIAKATSPEGASAYVPISPCRLLDTRADSPVGSPLGALGPDTEITVNGWGAQGNCTLPSDTTGLELNVTAVDASTLTNLRVYPEGVDTPTASNLNPAPGEPPTPNSVSATLNTTNGQFHVFNRFGTVHIVIDVVGYYNDHMHDGDDIIDETLTGADVMDESLSGADVTDETLTGADVQNNTLSQIETSNEAGVAYNAEDFGTGNALTATDEFVVRTRINVPSDGYVVANAELQWENDTAGLDRGRCQLTKGADETIEGNLPYLRLTDGGDPNAGQFYSDTHQAVFEVAAADDTGTILTGFGQYINLVCDETDGGVEMEYATLTLEFYPTDYTSGGFIFIPFPSQSEDF